MLSAVWLVIFFFTLRFHRLNPFLASFFVQQQFMFVFSFFHIVTASMPYTFQCIQTSGYHFIILVVSFSECAIVYQVLVPYLLFILLNTHVTCTIFFVANFQLFFSPSTLIYTCFVCIWGCKLCPSFKHVLAHKIQDSHYLHSNFAQTFTF